MVASIIVIFVTFRWLNSYTNNGEYITLNDFYGLPIEQTIDILKDKKLNYTILDSNAYNPDFANHSVIAQDPKPEDQVKEGRMVYLYLSTNQAPMVEIPFLKGKYSQEAGIMKLRNAKFKIGDIFFKPSDTEGDILALMIDSVEIVEGQKAPVGTKIQLVVGGGLGGGKKKVPCLIGKTLTEAEFYLSSEDLNIGHINYGNRVLTDTSTAVIYKQMPSVEDPYIRIGTPIDIFFKQELPLNVNKCEIDSLQ